MWLVFQPDIKEEVEPDSLLGTAQTSRGYGLFYAPMLPAEACLSQGPPEEIAAPANSRDAVRQDEEEDETKPAVPCSNFGENRGSGHHQQH